VQKKKSLEQIVSAKDLSPWIISVFPPPFVTLPNISEMNMHRELFPLDNYNFFQSMLYSLTSKFPGTKHPQLPNET
jgi:hypothetical protein